MTAVNVTSSKFGMNVVGSYTPPLPYVSAVKHQGGTWSSVATSRPTNGADPNDPAYHWSALDSFLTYAVPKGWALVYGMGWAPSWSNGGQATQYPPLALSDYTDWCNAYFSKYPNGQIAAVEPWNEVNDATSNTGYAGTLSFLIQMEQALRTVIDDKSPSTLLLTPSTYYGPGLAYHANYFAAGGGQVCDGFCWHAYPLNIALKNNYEQWDNTTRYYRALLAQYGHSGWPIWITEGGYSNSDGDPLAMGAIFPLFMSCFADVSMPFAWNRPAGGNTALDYWLGVSYPQQSNQRGLGYKTMQSWLVGSTVTQEPTRTKLTNLVRNSAAAGATVGVIGSGGALPTNWTLTLSDAGVSASVTGTSYQGKSGVLVRVSGTPVANGSCSFAFEGNGQVLAGFDSTVSVGATIALAAGSMTNLSANMVMNEYTAGNGYLGTTINANNGLVAPIATPVYWEWSERIANLTTTNVIPKFGLNFTAGNAIDATFFIADARADLGTIWTATLTRDNGWQGLIAWDAAGGPTAYAVPVQYAWQRSAMNLLTPVVGNASALGRSPRLFESGKWGRP